MRTTSGYTGIIQSIGIGLFILFTLAPVAAAMGSNYRDLGESWHHLVLPGGRRMVLFRNSIILALSVAFSCMVISFLISLGLVRFTGKWSSRFRWLLLVLVPIPPYIHALAWSWFLFTISAIIPQVQPMGGFAAYWVQVMSFLPLAVATAIIGLDSVDKEFIEAGRILDKDWRVITQIIFPLVLPVLLTGAGFIFILSIVDYSVPSLFQYNVYSMEIFADFSAFYHPGRAFLLSLPLMILTSGLLIALLSNLRTLALKPIVTSQLTLPQFSLPPGFRVMVAVCTTILAFQIIIPLASQIYLIDSWTSLIQSIQTSTAEITTSLNVSILAAVFCTILAFPIANRLLRQTAPGLIWWAIAVIPLAFPAPLVGIGLESLWNQPGIQSIYSSNWILVLACIARFLPFAVLLLTAQLRRINPDLVDAAKIYRTDFIRTLTRITIPLYRPGILLSAALVFILSLGELGASLLVMPPGHATITIRIYNFLHYGASGTVAGLCLAVSAIVVLTGILVAAALDYARKKQGSSA